MLIFKEEADCWGAGVIRTLSGTLSDPGISPISKVLYCSARWASGKEVTIALKSCSPLSHPSKKKKKNVDVQILNRLLVKLYRDLKDRLYKMYLLHRFTQRRA